MGQKTPLKLLANLQRIGEIERGVILEAFVLVPFWTLVSEMGQDVGRGRSLANRDEGSLPVTQVFNMNYIELPTVSLPE